MNQNQLYSLENNVFINSTAINSNYCYRFAFPLIENFLTEKYNLDTVDKETLKNAQYKSLNNEINIKHEHKKLFRITENKKADLKMTFCWLKNGNIRPREEASLSFSRTEMHF